MERILRSEPLDFIQIHYSVNATNAAKTVLPLARDKGVGQQVAGSMTAARRASPCKGQSVPPRYSRALAACAATARELSRQIR